jgi:hypothetical protein
LASKTIGKAILQWDIIAAGVMMAGCRGPGRWVAVAVAVRMAARVAARVAVAVAGRMAVMLMVGARALQL